MTHMYFTEQNLMQAIYSKYLHLFQFKDYICHENSRQIAIIDYLFSMNFHGSIFSLLAICRENLCIKRIY